MTTHNDTGTRKKENEHPPAARQERRYNARFKGKTTERRQGMSDEEVQLADALGLLRSYSRHRDHVRLALLRVVHALEERGEVHDASKMSDDEFAGFCRINAAARIHKFGSEEYREGMRRERATIDLHFLRNTHHPECGDLRPWRGPSVSPIPMSFLDVVEMVCDWWGARAGYDDPRPWPESVRLNLEAKGKYLIPEQRWLVEQVAEFLGRAR